MLPARHNEWMPDIFNDFFDTNWMDRPKATCPAINVIETPEAYELQLAAPGMTKEDFNVHLDEEGDLVINMEKKVDNKEKEHKGHYLRREFSYTKRCPDRHHRQGQEGGTRKGPSADRGPVNLPARSSKPPFRGAGLFHIPVENVRPGWPDIFFVKIFQNICRIKF